MQPSNQEAKSGSLTEGPIAKTLFIFSLPILFSNVLQSLNGSINTIWVGRFLGEAAVAATSNAGILMFLMISSIFGLSMAAVIIIGQQLGAKAPDEAKRVVGTSLTFFTVLSFVVGGLGLAFSRQILIWMNTPDDVLDMAVQYTRIIFAGMPFLYGFNVVMAIMRGAGDSVTPFYFLLLSTGIDIVLNPFLIQGIGPFPQMGIQGSALAHFIAQMISLLLLIAHLYRKKYFLRITKADVPLLKIDWAIVKLMVVKGVPMGLNMIVVSLSSLFLVNIVNGYGKEASAAFGIANQISSYVQMPAMAIGAAVTSMASQNIGAGQWNRVNRITGIGVLFNIVLTGLLVGIIHLFNRQALALFLPSGEKAIELGMVINTMTLWSFVLFGIFNVLAGVVRAAGAVNVPLLISFIALFLVRVPLAAYLGSQFGFNAIWWSFPAGFLMATVLTYFYYASGRWRKGAIMKEAM